GDEVVIKKAGDVIPQITQIIKLNKNGIWLPPTNCPSCGSILKWNSTNIYQVCTNNDCPQKVVNYLTHFASKTGLDIKGVSEKRRMREVSRNFRRRNPKRTEKLFSKTQKFGTGGRTEKNLKWLNNYLLLSQEDSSDFLS